jgi:DNA-binding response OmpR family regulator
MDQDIRPILVVDDDQAVRDVLLMTLLLEGYPVREAANGAEALQVIEDESPSLVVLDMQMPVLDGWGFIQELRERDFDAPVLVMTAGRNACTVAADLNAAGYVGKPFDIDELLVKVEPAPQFRHVIQQGWSRPRRARIAAPPRHG